MKTISESDCEATENSFSEVTTSKLKEQKIRNPRKVSRKTKAVVSSYPIEPTSNTELSSLLRKRKSELDATSTSNEVGAVADGNMKESPALHVRKSDMEKGAGVIVNSPKKELLYKVVKYSRK